MQHVTGLGGVFFKATDPQALQAWYRQHLGLPSEADDTVVFWWRQLQGLPHVGSTVWSVMPHDTTYMGDKPEQQVMVNFRVENLDAMLEQLRSAGVTVIEQVKEMEFGRFGWFVDPEGNRMELWQPVKNEAALMTPVVPAQASLPVDRDAQISLRPITQETVREIWRLQVMPSQENFVAPNVYSLAEALFSPVAWFRAIYADETPVGFVMMVDDPSKPEYFLWRFMIDQRYQRLHYGERALQLVIDYVRTRPGATELGVSCVPGNGSPCPFYEKMGFVYTGQEDEGELVMRLVL